MVTVGQILIKIGLGCDRACHWDGSKAVPLTYPEFVEIMRAPGAFSLNAKKTIDEKWSSLSYYSRLVVSQAPPEGKARVYNLDPEIARQLIRETIPKSVKEARRDRYLLTGEV